jgi:hypothetical protein
MAAATQDKRVDLEALDDEATIAAANAAGDTSAGGDVVSLADREGKTVDELVDEGADAEPEKPTPPGQMALPGTREKLTGTAGGKQPTDSEIRLMGGKRPIIGQYDKGEHVVVLVSAVIRSIEMSDTSDDWGNVERTTRIHKARQLLVQVATAEVLLRALAASGVTEAELLTLFREVNG